MKTTTLLTLLISLFIFTGCANKIELKPNNVVNDISKLKQSESDENSYYYIKKDVNFSKYNKIKVPKINVYMAKDKEGVQKIVDDASNYFTDNKNNIANKKLLNDISTYFTTNLEKNLQEVVKNRRIRKNTLVFQASIISLDVSYDNLEFYQYLPYGLAFTAIKRSTGIEDKKLRVGFALKVFDEKTKETLITVVKHDISDSNVSNSKDLKIDDLKPVLDKWIKRYSSKMEQLKKTNYKI
ncbi:hypothetical protein GCM10012288_23000 [Malaciobacter pacificus]|jgi:hypothetical protein|uniref:DUF3313 domain-containing protein n=1 Tax=Malaciobacter pacificus TaxID=1080223 RepID=A0A5C2HDG7_9BACT|nr:DUF3313 family protein [Malaciobacter pacificus]QEP34874.1 DUF3313 domain-containing protein [Malaciobacter pacificus]GGD48145.1 hypothetical protein GCM10012288_23000 [Malaciobacter pacificus]